MQRKWHLAAIGLLAIAIGSLVAYITQTTGGIQIRDVRFAGKNGNIMSALLYIPPNATSRTPAPGILAVHGYINSRETQSGFAIEFARRGYVVLALDQTGHGYSDPPAFANGFGGPDGLAYLRSLDIVDKSNIGLEGHSMGGWTILAAAAAMPDAYKAIVLEGSSVGAPRASEGTPTWPRNLALVYSKYDEFSQLMWDVARARDVGNSPKLLKLFGTTQPVKPGDVYGNIAEGTARVLYAPAVTHPGDHISSEAIGYSIDWFAKTLNGGTPLPSSDQIWFRKEFGTLIAFAGFVAFLLGVFRLLLDLPAFSGLAVDPGGVQVEPSARGRSWWAALLVTAFMPAILYYPVFSLAGSFVPPSSALPQGITNQIAVWVLVNAVISFFLTKKAPVGRLSQAAIMPSIFIGLTTVAIAYLSLVLADLLFKVDFRFWIVALKLLSGKQALMFAIYLLPFLAFFIVAFRSIRLTLYRPGEPATVTYLTCVAAFSLGFAVLCLVQYGALWLNGKLIDPLPDLIQAVSLNSIVALQFVVVLAVIGIIAAFTMRRTSSSLPGAVMCALFVTWYVVAGQATQAAF